MGILDPARFFAQADRLLHSSSVPEAGPNEEDLRRAVSAAYYGLFHAVTTAAADQLIGMSRRHARLYERVVRSIDHKQLKGLCETIKRSALPDKYALHAPPGGFGNEMKAFAAIFVELQEEREDADYSVSKTFSVTSVQQSIKTAREGVDRFIAAEAAERECFLGLLVFPPRR